VKGRSEARVREALERLAEDMPLVWWKPPDDARNWKPADFLVWVGPQDRESFEWGSSAMLEVKDNPNLNTYPASDLRPTQRAWMRQAAKIGLPYFLVIWWRRRQRWTVSDAAKVVRWVDLIYDDGPTSMAWDLLAGSWGVDCTTDHLAGTIGAALRGEVG
jgi:hypothetical protein